MRCRSCGHPIDANSRFCTYCDCDNYPEMNQVKTKGHSAGVKQETIVSRTYTNDNSERKPQSQQTNDKRAAAGCIFFAAFIFIIFIIIFTVSIN